MQRIKKVCFDRATWICRIDYTRTRVLAFITLQFWQGS